MQTVFIHLGEAKVSHLKLNIERHLLDFPDNQVTLILNNRKTLPSIKHKNFELYWYKGDSTFNSLWNNMILDNNFRKGFWRFSLERLFAIIEYQNSIKVDKILHIESDVLLFNGFPWKKFQDLNKLSWCRYNAVRDVSSLLLIPNIESGNWLKEKMYEELSRRKNLTDMMLLSIISHKYEDRIFILPSISAQIDEMVNSKSLMNDRERKTITLGEEYFGGIFDPAAIGMWLAGQDPRNYYGLTRYRTEEIIESGDSYIDPAALQYKVQSNLELFSNSTKIPVKIWNLHVHSKNNKLFLSDWEVELKRIAERNKKSKYLSDFDSKILLTLLRENLSQGTFMRYVIGFPPLRNFLKPLIYLIKKFVKR